MHLAGVYARASALFAFMVLVFLILAETPFRVALIATGMIGVCEALLYGYKSGLDLPTVLKSVSSGAAGSWSLSNLGPRIIDNNFDPGFFVEHFIKDMGIALEESRRMGLSLPGLALGQQLYLAVKAQGFGRNGTHALMLALASLSGIDWRKRG